MNRPKERPKEALKDLCITDKKLHKTFVIFCEFF